ncbi:MAG: competence protein CoiA family protein [Janthinobacterium lividum]
MSTTVECDRACLADGQEISIAKATSGANGYFCLGCGYELMARKGEVNTPHFAHVPTGTDIERSCDYSSETYRHEQAKKLLQRLKKVQVPAVYAARPPGYHGRLPQLAEAREVVAARVLNECNIYMDEHAEVCFAQRHRNELFDEQQSRRLLLARPDIVFLDKQGTPILLIEIYATHKVNEEKLTRLRMLGLDAIEIDVPRHCDPAAIEQLFSSTTHTHWLYNGQQAKFGPLAPDSPLLAGGSATTVDLEDRLSGRQETLKCRRSRVGHALRAVRSCLGRADIKDIQGEIDTAQAAGEAFIARSRVDKTRLEARRSERDERLGKAIQQRVADHREALATQERELAAQEAAFGREESELAERISQVKIQLCDLVAELTQQIKRAESAVENEFGDGMEAIRDERNRRWTELSQLGHQAAAVTGAAAKLDREATELEPQERSLGVAAKTNRSGLERATRDFRKYEQLTAELEKQTAILHQLESQAC